MATVLPRWIRRLEEGSNRVHARWRLLQSCLAVLGGLLLFLAGCFGFSSTPGLFELGRTPEPKTLAQMREGSFSLGEVAEVRGFELEPVPGERRYHLGWLREAGAEAPGAAPEVLLWSSKAFDANRGSVVLRRVDPHEMLTAQKDALEALRPRSTWGGLIVVEPYEVDMIPAALMASLGLLFAALAARQARQRW